MARDHVQLIAVIVLAVTVIGFVALSTERLLAQAALLASAATLALLGLWVIAAMGATPPWLPAGFMFTLPAALVLIVGAVRRLPFSRDVGGG